MSIDTLNSNSNNHLRRDPASLGTSDTFTFWSRIKSRIINTDRGWFIAGEPSGGDNAQAIRYDTSGGSGGGDDVIKAGVTTDADPGERQIESSALVQTTNWQTVAWVCRGGGLDLQFYIDGQIDTPTFVETTIGNITGLIKLVIGKGGKDTGNNTWDGLIDEIRVYGRALGAAEIQTLDTLNGQDGIIDGRSLYWKFNEGSPGTTMVGADIVKDYGLFGRHLTPIASPQWAETRCSCRRRVS